MEEKEYYSLPELAKILGISRIAVYKKVTKGQIPALKIGKNYAVPKKYIEKILGKELDEEDKAEIKTAVKRVVSEYGDVLKKLGKE